MKRRAVGKRSTGPDQHWGDIKKMLDLGLELRRPYERQWVLNMAFITGNQYAAFNAATHTLQRLARVPGKVRSVDNIILPKWKRQVSDLIKARPKISVVPNSKQEEDIDAAKLAKKAAEWYYREHLLRTKIRELAVWIYTTGNAFLDDSWDPKGGRIGINQATGDVVYEGDVGSSVWSPFDIVAPVSFGNSSLADLPWIAKMKRKSLAWLTENYKRGNEVAEEKISSSYLTLEGLVGVLMGSSGVEKVPSAYLVNLYIKPCKEYPKGAFFAAANGVVFEKKDWPYGDFCLEHFKDIEYPGVFWGDATMSHAIGLQRDWNADVSSIVEFNKKVAKAKIRNPAGSNLQVTMDDTHGEIISYKPVLGHKPEYMQLSGLSPTLDKNMERVQFSLENLFSQHEVSRGTNRSDIRSGNMVELLLEQDAHGTIPSHAIFEEGLEGHLRRILQRIQAGYTAERTLKIGETYDDFEVVAFKGADIKGNTDIKIVKESSLPDSPAAREMQVERRYQMGLLGNPEDPRVRRKVLRMIDENVVDDMFSGDKQDEMLANWENKKMMQGLETMVNTYDGHQTHLEEHHRVRKSIRYQGVRDQHSQFFEQVEGVFELHCQQHTAALNEEMKKQMQMTMVAKGG